MLSGVIPLLSLSDQRGGLRHPRIGRLSTAIDHQIAGGGLWINGLAFEDLNDFETGAVLRQSLQGVLREPGDCRGAAAKMRLIH